MEEKTVVRFWKIFVTISVISLNSILSYVCFNDSSQMNSEVSKFYLIVTVPILILFGLFSLSYLISLMQINTIEEILKIKFMEKEGD